MIPIQYNPKGTSILGEVQSTFGYLRRQAWTAPVALAAANLLALTATSASETTTLTPTAQPDVPRGISVTPGGTTADVAAGSYVVTGTNIRDEVITETLTFAANATNKQVTTKAFKTVTSVLVPIQDGAGATFSIGVEDNFGLDRKMSGNEVILMTADGVQETTAPTVTFSATAIESNTVNPDTAADASVDFAVLYVSTEKTDKRHTTS